MKKLLWKEKSGCTSPAEALVRINLGKECMQLSVGHEQLLELRVALEGTGPHWSNLYMGGETEHKFTSGRKKLELGFAVECEGRKSCPILQLCRSRDGLQRPLLAHWQGKLPGEGGPVVAFVIFLFCFKFMIGKVICSDSEAKKDLYKKGNCIACNCSSVSCSPLLSSSQLDHAASFIKLCSPGWGTRQRTAGPAGCSQRNITCVPGGARSGRGRPQGLFVFKQGCTRAAWLGLASTVCPSSKSHAQLWGKLNVGYLRTPARPPLNDISSIIPT